MALLEDSFTGTDGTPLGDGTGGTHGPDVTSIGGYTYSSGDRNCQIGPDNQLETLSDGPAQVCTFDLGDADQQIIFQVPGDTQTNNSRFALRLVDNDDFAVAATTVGSDTIEITKRDGGATTQLDTFSFSPGDKIRLKAEGDTVSWWLSTHVPADHLADDNWTAVDSATNTNANTETKAGFWLRGTSSSNTDDSDWIDNLQADTYPATATDFPVVEATNTSFEDDQLSGSPVVDLPAGIESGELLVIGYSGRREVDEAPSGWSIDATVNNGSTNWAHILTKVADGTEGSTVTLSTDGVGRSAHISWRISGHNDGEVETATAIGSGNNPDTPSLTPTFDQGDTLWLTLFGATEPADFEVVEYPALYSGGITSTEDPDSSSTSDYIVAAAVRGRDAASEDPGAFTVASPSGSAWNGITLAIRAAADEGDAVEVDGVESRSDAPAQSGVITTGHVLAGVESRSAATANAGEAAAGHALDGVEARSASIANAGATAVGQALAGVEARSTAVSNPGTVEIGHALDGVTARSESPANAGVADIGEGIELTGVRALSPSAAQPGAIEVGVALSGVESRSTAPSNAGVVVVGDEIPVSVSGVESVAASPSNAGAISVGVNLTGAASLAEALSAPGQIVLGHDLDGTEAISVSRALAGAVFTGLVLNRPIENTEAKRIGRTYAAERTGIDYAATWTGRDYSINRS